MEQSLTVTGGVPLGLILAGKPHPSVVYFARVCDGIKIGHTTNLTTRMRRLYVPLKWVLLVLPGGQPEEDAWHRHFAAYHVRGEVFNIERQLRHLLATDSPYTAQVHDPPPAPGAAARLADADLLALAARPQGVSSRESATLLLGTSRSRMTTGSRLEQFQAAGLVELRGKGPGQRYHATGKELP